VPVLRRLTASEELFRVLRDAILTGQYAPGEKLPPQRALAQEYALNATTVREAIKRLEQLRLVEVRHGDAVRVSDWRTQSGLDVIAHVLFDTGGVRHDTLDALMEARRGLLVGCAALAAARRSDDQAAELRALAATAAAPPQDANAAQLTDFAFFATIVEAAGNLVFTLVLNSTREVYFEHAAFFTTMVAPELELGPFYERAAAAIEIGDGDGAQAAVAELTLRQEQALR